MKRVETEPYRRALKVALDALIAEGKVSSLTDWCRKAGISEGTVRAFLKGQTRGMGIEQYAALSGAANRPITWLLGEAITAEQKEVLILEAYRMADSRGKQLLELQAEREILASRASSPRPDQA